MCACTSRAVLCRSRACLLNPLAFPCCLPDWPQCLPPFLRCLSLCLPACICSFPHCLSASFSACFPASSVSLPPFILWPSPHCLPAPLTFSLPCQGTVLCVLEAVVPCYTYCCPSPSSPTTFCIPTQPPTTRPPQPRFIFPHRLPQRYLPKHSLTPFCLTSHTRIVELKRQHMNLLKLYLCWPTEGITIKLRPCLIVS